MNNDKTGVDLDLDALAPKQVQINYQDRLIKINPLSLAQFSKLYDLAGDLAKIKDDQDAENLLSVFQRVDELVKECIPELAQDTLNQLQLTALLNLLSEISAPQDKALAELKKRGINLTGQEGGKKSDPKALTS